MIPPLDPLLVCFAVSSTTHDWNVAKQVLGAVGFEGLDAADLAHLQRQWDYMLIVRDMARAYDSQSTNEHSTAIRAYISGLRKDLGFASGNNK